MQYHHYCIFQSFIACIHSCNSLLNINIVIKFGYTYIHTHIHTYTHTCIHTALAMAGMIHSVKLICTYNIAIVVWLTLLTRVAEFEQQ